MSVLYEGVNQRVFGTFPLEGRAVRDAIATAVDVGYRAFDTAQMYGNEADVGLALAESGVVRHELCITTKVHPDNFSEDRFLSSVEQSIHDLNGEPPDLLLLHWPTVGADVTPSLRLLQAAYDKGMTRNIGISNYTISQMETAANVLEAPISTNQVEFHPLIDQSKLLAAASKLGIPLSAYCSIARGKIFDHAELIDIGKQHNKSAAQVAVKWLLQKGICPITMSTKPDNIRSNFEVTDFTLSNVELADIDALAARVHTRITASVPWAPDWDS